MADSQSLSTMDGEKPSTATRPPLKDKPTEDHLEHYAEQTTHHGGYSSNLAAIQEAHGFKPEAGRLVVRAMSSPCRIGGIARLNR